MQIQRVVGVLYSNILFRVLVKTCMHGLLVSGGKRKDVYRFAMTPLLDPPLRLWLRRRKQHGTFCAPIALHS